MLQYINGEIFVLAIVEATRTLSLLGGTFFTLLLFIFIMKRVINNIYLWTLCHKKKFLHAIYILHEKHGLFIRRIAHLSSGFLLIFFSWTIVNILFVVFGAFLDHNVLSTFTLDEIKAIKYSLLEVEVMRSFTHFMTYSGVILVVLLFTAWFFIMIGSFISFFQKIAYLLFTLIIFFFFFTFFAGAYLDIFDKVLELHPIIAPIQKTK